MASYFSLDVHFSHLLLANACKKDLPVDEIRLREAVEDRDYRSSRHLSTVQEPGHVSISPAFTPRGKISPYVTSHVRNLLVSSEETKRREPINQKDNAEEILKP